MKTIKEFPQKTKFTINFTRGEQVAGDCCQPSSLEDALYCLKIEQRFYKGHPDFKGGNFELWVHHDDESSLIERSENC
jgi:hypothetical protein